jgi:HK97 gp10 family phage protein
MSEVRHVKGLAELQKFLDELAPKMEKNVMRGGLRAGMKVVLPVARQNIHSVSGKLAAGLKLSTNAKGGTVTASIKARGEHGYIARWVEYGTAAHVIRAAHGKWLRLPDGTFVSEVLHPGAGAHPFMRPALDTQASAAVVAAGEYIKERLADKHGLDTAGIEIEAEE